MVNLLTGTAFDATERLHHGEDEVALEFPSSAGSRRRNLIAQKCQNWRAAKKGPDFGNRSVFCVTVAAGDLFRFDFIRLKSGVSSCTIDWGDGSTELVGSGTPCHQYVSAGTYVVQISDDINWFSCFGNPLVTSFVRWGDGITIGYNGNSGSGTFQGCSNLSGTVPAWNNVITNASRTYEGCSGLQGAIPSWGSLITVCYRTYFGCSGLTDVWPGATDEDLMPSRVTLSTACVSGASAMLRSHFTSAWGGTK